MTYPSTSNANGIWTLRDTFLARKGNIWPSVAYNLDPFFDYVSLLLSMDGDDASTTFTDSSNNNFSITAVGDAQISTSESKFGGASAAFDGTGDYLSIANNVAFQFGTGDFTVEGWFYASSQDKNFMTLFSIGSYTEGILLRRQNTSDNLYIAGSSYAYDQSYLPTGEWVHVALTRKSGQVILWLNGVQRLVATNTSNLAQTNNLFIGTSAHSLSDTWNGYIDDFRITKGFARYTADFTPPTLPFGTAAPVQLDPYFENYVLLLLHMDGTNGSTTFTDESINELTVTANGNAQISTSESKFGGASAYFDGTGDFLTIAHDAAIVFGSDSFTLECWVRPTSSAGGTIYSKRANTSTYAGLNLYAGVSNLYPALYVELGGGNFGWEIGATSSVALTLNGWNHVALVRNGSQWNLYINGVSGISATNSNSIYDDGSNVGIGAGNGASLPIEGYIDDFRITKGIARYTTNFTPPTKAFPDTLLTNDLYFDNVSLLLPMDGTNGSTTFTDESSNAFTVTSANAEISSEQSKFGGTSVKFLSTSGYLSLAEQSEFDFNTGDFTIEFWIRGTNFASNPNIYDTRPSGSGATGSMAVYMWSNKLRWQTNIVIDSTITPSNNVWYHVALTRQSGTSRMFIDGVLQNSFSDTNNYNVSRGPIIGNGWTLNGTGLTGYIDDFRITKGVARYTASFNPPTRAFPNE